MYRIEYPRPEFVRGEWMCLNGTWSFNFEGESHREIEVPFVFQSKMSGIGDNRMCDNVTYNRCFSIPDSWRGNRIMLRFGAVDYECRVYVNGHLAGEHIGGSAGFGFDITELLNMSEELLRVEVSDPCAEQDIPRGKQYWLEKPESIWYTRSTGIWQPVWLEPVPLVSVSSVRFTPDIDSGLVEIDYELDGNIDGNRLLFNITMEGIKVCSAAVDLTNNRGRLALDVFQGDIFRGMTHHSGWCWSPENPKLFSVEMLLMKADEVIDRVDTYFGMRKIEAREGKIFLNNRPYTPKLILDQGYWPESLMTGHSDEAFKQDILMAKELGFCGCRKHQKAEDPRFLYWADKIGFLVWAEIPACAGFSSRAVMRTAQEWTEIVSRDYNHPCIVAWVALNESWGVPNIAFDKQQQDFSLALYYLLRSIDKTRLVMGNDGWELTVGDICAIHCYNHGGSDEPEKIKSFAEAFSSMENIMALRPGDRALYADGYKYQGEPVMVTECGGISISGTRGEPSWGYTSATDEREFVETYGRIIDVFRSSPILCGFCYTQLADVEQENNGLLTADRRYKVDARLIREINDRYAK